MDEDRQDLLEVLTRRFGPVPADLAARVAALSDVQQVNRLILVAANAASLEVVRREIAEGPGAFRL